MAKVLINHLSQSELQKKNIPAWPIWEKEISEFEWFYDSDEECQLIQGDIEITTDEGVFNIKAGDYVYFKKGLKCIWKVNKPVKKHYNFP